MKPTGAEYIPGTIGCMTPAGDFDFNVVIRSAIISGKKLVYPVGGAITGDSDAGEEWDETLVKSKALRIKCSDSEKM